MDITADWKEYHTRLERSDIHKLDRSNELDLRDRRTSVRTVGRKTDKSSGQKLEREEPFVVFVQSDVVTT